MSRACQGCSRAVCVYKFYTVFLSLLCKFRWGNKFSCTNNLTHFKTCNFPKCFHTDHFALLCSEIWNRVQFVIWIETVVWNKLFEEQFNSETWQHRNDILTLRSSVPLGYSGVSISFFVSPAKPMLLRESGFLSCPSTENGFQHSNQLQLCKLIDSTGVTQVWLRA